jgi:hypothetical protein
MKERPRSEIGTGAGACAVRSVAPGALAAKELRACLFVIRARIRIDRRAASVLRPYGHYENRDCCPAKGHRLNYI